MIGIGVILLGSYLICLGLILYGYKKAMPFVTKEPVATVHFSILIPFRNEATNLPQLIQSLNRLNYPGTFFEVLFIDDESEDASVKVIYQCAPQFCFQVLTNKRISGSPKKDALTLGVSNAKYDWIITTDADCILPENFLLTYSAYINQHRTVFVSGGVQYNPKKGFLYNYQQLDNCSLQTTTVGMFGWHKPILCNGANMGYRKEIFFEVNGYEGNNHLASGDDVFLLEKVLSRYPKKVAFVKSSEVSVTTQAVDSWKDLLNQRIRWASKTGNQKSMVSKGVGIIIFLTNLYILIAWVYGFTECDFMLFFAWFVLVKWVMDFLYLFTSCSVLKKPPEATSYFFSFMVYPVITTWVVIKSLRKNYVWKGRTYSIKK